MDDDLKKDETENEDEVVPTHDPNSSAAGAGTPTIDKT